MMLGVWMVEWQDNFTLNAAFSTREKAMQYIEYEARYLKLQNFHEVEKGFTTWGGYEFDDYDDTKTRVFYTYYPVDTYNNLSK